MKLEGRMDERNRAVNGWTEEKETGGVEGFTNVGNKLAEERTDPNLALGCPSFSGCSSFSYIGREVLCTITRGKETILCLDNIIDILTS